MITPIENGEAYYCVCFHVGETSERLKLLRELIDDYHTPPQCPWVQTAAGKRRRRRRG